MNFAINHPVNLIAVVGLILDFWGVLLLFKYGLPSKQQSTIQLLVANDVDNVDEVEKENKRIEKMAYRGLGLIAAGFVLQLLSVIFHLSLDVFGK